MARQEGLIKLTGQMGGVSFYKTAQDGFLARTKGGVDGERIKNDAAFQRTRENGSEFGRAGTAGKLLRTAFRALTINTSDGRMPSRLTAEMMKVIKADATNLRGERNVIDGEAELLRGFEFNENAKLNRTFFAPYTATIDRTGGGATIDIPAFIPANMIAAPQGATHVRLVAACASIDFQGEDYGTDSASSAEQSVSSTAPLAALSLEMSFGETDGQPLFLAFGVEFYQVVNGAMYTLKNGAYNALTLVTVDGGA
ncbi:hypothetical protein [Parachryseolinea silvisoli]|uniref:hypothetical protein n=1 Tax=Parachryseolinea silvisoli TaxID=2873601 RepID=UPI002265EAE5|nr:hypothetical protein [Parachryseolinea silvisoli]MCD9017526.1 hypothetical protein [Parachryseolinea silvisoli]